VDTGARLYIVKQLLHYQVEYNMDYKMCQISEIFLKKNYIKMTTHYVAR
jgi:hypothetical protein